MSKINALELLSSGAIKPTSGSSAVNVTIEPVVGLGLTQLGMFNISLTLVNPSDTLVSPQFIVQYEGQAAQAFSAFIFLDDGNGTVSQAGAGYGATPMYCGADADAVAMNRQGKALTVMVVGGVNSSPSPFFITKKFTINLWPAQ